jgi:hypothetical protein
MSRTDMLTAYESGTWDLLIVDMAYFSLPTELRTIVLDRIAENKAVIFGHYNLDGDSELATALGVSTLDTQDPVAIYPNPSGPTNLFDDRETFPSPLDPNPIGVGDEGDLLTLLGEGDVLARGGAADGTPIVTRVGSTVTMGFLSYNYLGANADMDSMTDMVEFYVNLLSL